MIKKVLIGSAVVALLGTWVFGREFMSYVRTGATSVREAVRGEVPVEFELERARELVENLVPDIRACMTIVAEQQVDAENLREDLLAKEENLQKQQGEILALREELRRGEEQYVFAGRTYSSNEVKHDLQTRFERFKAFEETVNMDRRILEARETALKANEEKLENMLHEKKELEVKLEQLQARLNAVRAAETVSNLEIDDSQLARAKKLIRDLNRQLDVKQKMLDAEGKVVGLIPIEPTERPVSETIGEDIDSYFGTTAPAEAAPAL